MLPSSSEGKEDGTLERWCPTTTLLGLTTHKTTTWKRRSFKSLYDVCVRVYVIFHLLENQQIFFFVTF
jgi:hypothetical protein